MNPDWKGEHLIRHVKIEKSQGNGHNFKKPRQKHAPLSTMCAVPECTKLLARENKSGVCRSHMHTAYCGCFFCEKEEAKRRAKLNGRACTAETDGQPIPVTIRGVEFPSMAAAAKNFGVNIAAVSRAKKRGTLDNVGVGAGCYTRTNN